MNLSEIEVIASEYIEQEKRLDQIDDELVLVESEAKEEPKRAGRDRKFHSLIGLEWKESGELNERREKLRLEKVEAERHVDDAKEKLLNGFSSSELVVPLEPNSVQEGQRHTFRYRSQATYPKAMQALSQLLGIAVPLSVDDVEIGPDRIVVMEPEPYEAKEKVVDAFEKIRKTVALKLRNPR